VILNEGSVGKYSINGGLRMSVELLEQIRDQLRDANMLRNESEFCERWLGKGQCYMRTLRFQQLEPSAEALATLGSKLGYYANELIRQGDSRSQHWAEVFTALRRRTQAALEVRMRERWQKACAVK